MDTAFFNLTKTEVVMSAKYETTIIDYYYYQRNGEWDLIFWAVVDRVPHNMFYAPRIVFFFKASVEQKKVSRFCCRKAKELRNKK